MNKFENDIAEGLRNRLGEKTVSKISDIKIYAYKETVSMFVYFEEKSFDLDEIFNIVKIGEELSKRKTIYIEWQPIGFYVRVVYEKESEE